METITFNKLKLKNVRNHNEIEIDFPIDQLVALVGKNGSGKSTIAMALMAGLYGDPGSDLTVPDMLNEKVNKNMEILIDFNIDDTNYEVERYYKHKKNSNALILKKNGVNISSKTTPETYKIIEKILVPKDVFCNTVYFAQQVKDFFTALTDSQQKKIFNAILGLENYPIYYDLANKKLSSINDKKLLFDKDLLKLQSILPEQENLLIVAKNNLEENKNEKLKNIKSCENDIVTRTQKIETLNSKISQIDFDENELQSIISELSKHNHSLNIIDEEYEKEKNLIIKDFQNEKEKVASSSEKKLLNNKNKIQEMFAKKKDELTSDANEFKIKIDNISKTILDKINKNEEKYRNSIDELKQKIQENEKTIIEYENDEILKSIKKEKDEKYLMKKDTLHDCLVKEKENELIISKLNESLDSIKSEIFELSENMKKDIKICPTCGQEIKSTKHIKNEIDKRKKKEKEIEKNIKTENEKSEVIKQTIVDINKNMDDISTQYDKQIEKRRINISEKINELKKEIDNIQNNISSVESDKQKILLDLRNEESNHIAKIQIEIDKITKQISDEKEKLITSFNEIKNEEIKYVENQISKYEHIKNEQEEKLNDKFNIKKKSLFSIVEKLENDKGNLVKIQNQINDIKRSISVEENLITENQKDIERINSELQNVNKEEIIKIENNIETTKNQINSLEIKITNIDKLINICQFWKEAFSNRGIPSMLIDSSIPFMNQTIKNELNKICSGKFTVSFDTMTQNKSGEYKEKFGINILNNFNGASSHKKLSGGEKRIIDVCCMRTLKLLAENLYQKKFNLTILDEILDSLDEECASTFCYYLKKLSEGQNIILMTHSSSRVSEADSVLRMS